MTAVQLVASLLALIPVVATNALVAHDARRHPIPTETLTMNAWREGRQCTTAIYTIFGGYPDRCAYPADHYDECAP